MKTNAKTWPTAKVLGIQVDCIQREELLEALRDRIATQTLPWHVVTMNAEMAEAAQRDPKVMALLQQADLVIPDGIGIVWALKQQGIQVQRLPGVELVESLLQRAPEKQWRIGILGSSPETLAAFQALLPQRFGAVKLVFCQHGYFQPETEPELVAAIQAAQPDLLFVALGVPRQEDWIARHRNTLQVPILMGVGGSFDVLSGHLKRAPLWMRRLHLEWFFRLLQQPSRWRRMLALPRFVIKVLRT